MSPEHNADATRKKILDIAAEEIHVRGFQASNTSDIIKKANISKGALYHHFNNKLELGYAVFDEVFAPKVTAMWQPIFESKQPIEDMILFFQDMLTWTNCSVLSKGCPINNLAQEMSAVDEGFRVRINTTMQAWQHGISQALRRGQENGQLNQAIDVERTAIFLIASIEGAYGLAKNAQDEEVFSSCIYGLIDSLKRL